MAPLRIALAQVDPWVGDLSRNTEMILERTRQAADQGARLVAFGEMALTGYPIEDLALRASFRHAAQDAATALALRLEHTGLGDITVVLGTVGTSEDGRPTNRALALAHGTVSAVYDKQCLANYGVFDEYRVFAPGSTPVVIKVDGHRVGLAICEDIWVTDGPVSAMRDLDLVVVLNGSPYEQGKETQRLQVATRCVAQTGCPVAYVNLAGAQDDLVFDGGSFIVDSEAAVVARAQRFAEDSLVWDLGTRTTISTPTPMVAAEEVYRACVTGLAGYVHKNGFRTVTLGLSGGIDSALVAAMAADAIGGQNIVGVSMPSRYSSGHSQDDAKDLADRLGADFRVQPITPMVDAFESQLRLEGVAAENLQARVRGMILMALSNSEGHLVLATGNKSELAVGYSTIYGDAVGGYAPLKDVAKSLVWHVARWRNDTALDAGQIPPIPENSITKPPSAELRPGQLDQDSLPPYDQLDEVLDAYLGRSEGRMQLLARGFDPDIVETVVTLVDRAEWKRRQYPPGPKTTALAFGRDRRLPITSRWREPLT